MRVYKIHISTPHNMSVENDYSWVKYDLRLELKSTNISQNINRNEECLYNSKIRFPLANDDVLLGPMDNNGLQMFGHIST